MLPDSQSICISSCDVETCQTDIDLLLLPGEILVEGYVHQYMDNASLALSTILRRAGLEVQRSVGMLLGLLVNVGNVGNLVLLIKGVDQSFQYRFGLVPYSLFCWAGLSSCWLYTPNKKRNVSEACKTLIFQTALISYPCLMGVESENPPRPRM